MRLVSCRYQGQTRWGTIDQNEDVYLAPSTTDWPGSVRELLEARDEPIRVAEQVRHAGVGPVDSGQISFQAPIPRPRQNVMCLGLNYAAHAEESMRAKGRAPEVPEHPVVFTKSADCVTGPGSDVPLDPEITNQLDWEVELGVVIGQSVHKPDTAAARAAIFGYTVINDLSARDLQFRHKQFFLGKSLARACPMGPSLVTADEISDPQALALSCRVNGELKQDGHTGDQVFGAVEIVHRLASIMTLAPGDIIATGTPDGVGFARTPPEFLAAGDRVECQVEGIGTLTNRIALPEEVY